MDNFMDLDGFVPSGIAKESAPKRRGRRPKIDTTGMPDTIKKRVEAQNDKAGKEEQREISEMAAKIDAARKKREAEKRELEDLRAQNKAMAEQLAETRQQLAAKNAEAATDQSAELQSYRERYERDQQTIDELLTRVNHLQNAPEAGKVADLEAKIEALTAENERLRTNAVALQRKDVRKANWRIWKSGVLVADGVPLEEACKLAGISINNAVKMRQYGLRWKLRAEGDEGYEG